MQQLEQSSEVRETERKIRSVATVYSEQKTVKEEYNKDLMNVYVLPGLGILL